MPSETKKTSESVKTPSDSESLDAIAQFLAQQGPGSLSSVAAVTSDAEQQPSHPVNGNGNAAEKVDKEVEMSDEEILELLRKLEEADGVASGIEDKLDGILENLDSMLDRLEGRAEGNVAHTNGQAGNESTPQPKGKSAAASYPSTDS